MKKVYNIEVDCPNCANLMEATVRKVGGVVDAQVNFFAQKLSVEFADGADVASVMAEVVKRCRKVERDSVIYI